MSNKTRIFFDVENDKVDAFKEIIEELKRAQELHPDWPADNTNWKLTIVTKELGQTAKAFLKYNEDNGAWNDVLKEANQLAAMGIRFRLNLRKNI